jgi:hypothetical protein
MPVGVDAGHRLIAADVLGVGPGADVLGDLESVAGAAEGTLLRARASDEVDAQRVLGTLGDDVDDAVDGIGAPEGAARAADHLDAVDILEERVLHVPEDAGMERGVDAAAVDENKEFVGRSAVEAAARDGP